MEAIGRFHKLQRWPQNACFHQAISYFIQRWIVFFFLLACLAPYLNPQKWWFISFLVSGSLSIGSSDLVYAMVVVCKKKICHISALALLLGIKSISVFFAFHFTEVSIIKRTRFDTDATWNVARFIEMKRNNNKGSQIRLKRWN